MRGQCNMTAQYVPNLGELCTDDALRDTVHIAVAPVVASHHLQPGDHVGLFADGTAGNSQPYIGVVDPFLKHAVEPGQRFWLCLYPGTVTGLRHQWRHPAFAPRVPGGAE